MIRTAIFDDNRDRRDSLAVLLQTDSEFVLCGAFPDCNNVLEDVGNCRPDVVLMDIDMPGINGIDATRLIKGKWPGVHIVIQTVFENEDSIFNAIRAGASGYLLKSSNAERILQALKDVMEGGAPMTPSIAARVIRHYQEQPVIQHVDYGLSEREQQVLSYLVKGMSYKMISDEMNISYNTVNSHIKKIYEKLQVHSVGEAVSKALSNKVIV
jgi:DNA-binding NarL/FixJ family response regulator